MTKLVQTFVKGLDEQLEGGISKGHVVLIAGPPGTMKSMFALSILYRNLRVNGIKGLYISVEESKESLLKGMEKLGMNDFDEEGLVIVDIGLLRLDYKIVEDTRDWLKILKEYLQRRIKEEGFELVVVDSLSALYSITSFTNPRQDLFHFFGFLKSLGATTFLISEMTESENIYGPYREDFLADGVIHLKYHEVGETDVQLRIRCVKMRHSKHFRGYLVLIPKEGGFMVTPVISE